MNVLAKLQRTKEEGHVAAPDQEGDDYDFWQNLDLERLKRYELRNYLAARDLGTGGKKKEWRAQVRVLGLGCILLACACVQASLQNPQ